MEVGFIIHYNIVNDFTNGILLNTSSVEKKCVSIVEFIWKRFKEKHIIITLRELKGFWLLIFVYGNTYNNCHLQP